ncbi:F-box/WD repeat-containing protein 5 [Eurytemora carolleeae]|uniref:F-box/WD repeat-containing protein 5 n=1 Tax=Eurytemora carolleeae TaxID=1294199 RepID=UPI000C78D50E|nr:F-box/WD repeat-containing protein 5 [Eurytemora carolleeae]|eukprot:XP_023329717.1 F-box/WD repeat-containing protein 5-like [Eurytemora affinis]
MLDLVMNMDRLSWKTIPEPLLIRVLGFLTVPDIANASAVCHRWCEIALDNALWRGILRRRFRLRNPGLCLRVPGSTWREEYKRMRDNSPSVCSQELSNHTDEVLHVSFSNSGEQFVTCSKDGSVIIWRFSSDFHAELEHQESMRRYEWKYTWASRFNCSDTLLLVAGVVSDINGEIAVFMKTTDNEKNKSNYSILCRVSNNPYDVMGDWVSEFHFFSGRLIESPDVDGASSALYICEANPSLSLNPDISSPYASNVIKHVVLRMQDENINYLRCLHVTNRSMFKDDNAFTALNNRVEFIEELQVDAPCLQILTENRICLVFLSNAESLAPHLLGFCLVKPEDLSNVPFISCPDRVINMEGHIVGLALSPDSRYLYVNVRRWPENCEPNLLESPAIASEIELRVVDLENLTLMNTVYSGHKGFTDSMGAFYIYIDVSKDFVGSGSEDELLFYWSRYYGCLVSELEHSACVNSTAFCPSNQQIIVTASDDHKVKVWKSRALMRNRSKSEIG